MKKSKTASAGKSRSTTKKPPARAAEAPRNALRDLAPRGKAPERLPARSAAKTKSAKKPRPGLFQ
jgi:hypothetical protein